MITFVYNGSIQKLHDAIAEAHKILANDDFYKLIKERGNFDLADCTATQVADRLRNCNLNSQVKTYKHPFGPSLGKEFPITDPTSVYINVSPIKFKNRTIPSVVNTLIHEAVHAADSDCADFDFGHGEDNHSKGKGLTAPYWIGCWAEMILENPGKVITVAQVDAQSKAYCG